MVDKEELFTVTVVMEDLFTVTVVLHGMTPEDIGVLRHQLDVEDFEYNLKTAAE